MHTEVPEILVRAPRVTLDEILDRVARGEARRESLLVDESFTATFRIVRASKDKPELFDERVMQVYKKKPDKVRSVLLRHWTAKPQKKKGDVALSFRSSMGDEPRKCSSAGTSSARSSCRATRGHKTWRASKRHARRTKARCTPPLDARGCRR